MMSLVDSAAKKRKTLTPEQRAKAVIRVRQWRLDNPERAKELRAKENKEKRRESNRAWAKANEEKVKASRKKYRILHKDSIRLSNAGYRKANVKKQSDYTAAWRKANPEASRAIVRNRRARMRSSCGKHDAHDIIGLVRIQGGKCAWCRRSVIKQRHVDHIIPIALGGSNNRSNLQILCPPCNRSKGSLHPIEFAQREGRLL